MRDDSGIGLIDLLVGLLLSAAVLATITTGLTVATRADRYSGDASEALATLRISMERLGKELRQARRVYADSSARSIHFWVDADNNKVQDPAERVTWELRDEDGDGVGDLLRRTDAETGWAPMGTGLAIRDTFTYVGGIAQVAAGQNGSASTVGVSLVAMIPAGADESSRTLSTEVKLRNVRAA